jgi:hypothetical protein
MTEEALLTLVSWLVAAIAVPMSAQLIAQSWSRRRPAAVELGRGVARKTIGKGRPASRQR